MVATAAALYPEQPAWDGSEGPRARLIIAPGVLTLTRPDPAKRERTANRQADHHSRAVDQAAICLSEHGSTDHEPSQRGAIRAWSARSRARMVRRLAELDWTPLAVSGRLPAMITLTYPGDWLAAAPTAAVMDAHLRQFYKRFERAWGEPLVCCWKKEFQRRGAPHWHAYMTPPLGNAGELRALTAVRRRPAAGDGLPFRQWLSVVWADIVDHPDPEQRRRHELAGTGVDYAEGMRSADPKRLAIYFTKHGQFRAKEYQDRPPAEWTATGRVGRFWGYRGLRPVTAAVGLAPADYDRLARTLRRYVGAQRVTRQVAVPRARGGMARPARRDVVGLAGAQLLGAHRVKRRSVRRRARYLACGAGFVCVNDGPRLAAQLARMVTPLQNSARSLGRWPEARRS